jgi:hypothetical protein
VRQILRVLRGIVTASRPAACAFDIASAAWGARHLNILKRRDLPEGYRPMKETPQEYIQRIVGYLAGQDPLDIQVRTPRELDRLIEAASASRLHQRPAPAKWSIAEILAHLADVEIVVSWRIRAILGAPGILIQVMDQDAWVSAGHYDKRDPRKSIELFRVLREANVELFKTLTPEQWKHHGMHAERGAESVEQIVRLYAGHDLNHTRQIEQILS